MTVAGVVILYHPDEDVLTNIQSYLPHIGKLYVADNTENKMSSIASQLLADNKIQVLYDSANKGIAKRLNEAARLAISEGYNWLLTMDQDSRFEEGELENYFLCVEGFLDKDRTTMFGVEYEEEDENNKTCMPIEKNKLITSGSILNLHLFLEVGDFEERLFIDEVDHDYCYRARLMNYLVVRFQNIFLHHSLGTSSRHRSLKSMKFTKRSLHSPQRIYYMTRNYLYMNHRFKKDFPLDIIEDRNALLNRIKNNLFYGKKKFKTLSYIIKGWIDYTFKTSKNK